MKTVKPQYVDIIIRGEQERVDKISKEAGFDEFSVGSNDEDKYVFQIPSDWSGWNKNRVFEMVDAEFGKEAYFGLSFVSIDNVQVVDERGDRIESFAVSHEGVAKTKWVKKKIIIVKRIDDGSRDSRWLLVSGWKFDGRYNPPMVNFLDLKCLKSELYSRFSLEKLFREA